MYLYPHSYICSECLVVDHNMMRARFIYLLLFSGVLHSFCTWRNTSLSKLGKMFSVLLKRNSLPSFILMTLTFDLFIVF